MATPEGEIMTSDSKVDFTRIYHQPDPRAYFRTLAALDYQIPQLALPIIEAALEAQAPQSPTEPRTLLDVCCSYGINAALLRYDLDFDELGARLADPVATAMPAQERIASDEAFYSERPARPGVDVLGLDISAEAVDYACQVGLLRDGWAENLEDAGPSAGLAAGLRDVDMLVCTGGVGYVGPATFERIMDSVERPEELWAVTFALRVFDCSEIVDVFAGAGLVTEQIPDQTFAQRRFADADEQAAAAHDVRRRGLDPAGKESAGWYHADCFITRPAAAAARTPIADFARHALGTSTPGFW